jgi:hypothetical protein
MIKSRIADRLQQSGIDSEAYGGAQVLCLPEHILHVPAGSELLETTDAISLVKELRAAGLTVFTFMDAGIDLAAMDRRAAEKWYGTVWIRDYAVVPLLVSVLGGSIVAHYAKTINQPAQIPSQNAPKVHIELIVQKRHGDTELKYDGDGETLVKILQAISDPPPNTQTEHGKKN